MSIVSSVQHRQVALVAFIAFFGNGAVSNAQFGEYDPAQPSEPIQARMQKVAVAETATGNDPVPAGEKSIREKLAQPLTVAFVETPFTDAMAFIAEHCELQVVFDEPELANENLDLAEPVSLSVGPVSAGSVLELLFTQFPVELTWVERDGVFQITTRLVADDVMSTRVYDVGDLVVTTDEQGRPASDFASLMEVLRTQTSGPWFDLDGVGGTMSEFETAGIDGLIIRQTRRQHQEVEDVLTQLRLLRDNDEMKMSPVPDWLAELQVRLQQRIKMDLVDVPLAYVAEQVGEKIGAQILIDHPSVEDLGIDAGDLVSVQLNDVSAATALDFVLDPLDLTAEPRHEVIWITTQVEAAEDMQTMTYNVADLIGYWDLDGKEQRDDGPLIKVLMRETKGPWFAADGVGGTIAYYSTSGSDLMISRQTAENHRQVSQVLADLRTIRRSESKDE